MFNAFPKNPFCPDTMSLEPCPGSSDTVEKFVLSRFFASTWHRSIGSHDIPNLNVPEYCWAISPHILRHTQFSGRDCLRGPVVWKTRGTERDGAAITHGAPAEYPFMKQYKNRAATWPNDLDTETQWTGGRLDIERQCFQMFVFFLHKCSQHHPCWQLFFFFFFYGVVKV